MTASAKKRARGAVSLPIPSFQPIHHNDSRTSSRIGELEKAFFDEVDSDDNQDACKQRAVDDKATNARVKAAGAKVSNGHSAPTSKSKYCEVIEIVDSDDGDGSDDDIFLQP